ncbi:MAG: cupin domain-containing protein [Granulosicoccus sp.]
MSAKPLEPPETLTAAASEDMHIIYTQDGAAIANITRQQKPYGKQDPMKAINLNEKLATFSNHWSPRTVTTFNGHDVMVVKVKGEFNWHSHPDTDDFFLVIKGRITIRMRDGDVRLNQGEMYIVPKGVEHCPYAEEEAELLLIESTGTPNTGDSATAARRESI